MVDTGRGRIYRLLTGLVVLSLLLASGARPNQAQEETPTPAPAPAAQAAASIQRFLPVIRQPSSHRPPAVFGIETISMPTARVKQLNDLGANWVRYFTFDWSKIEPTRTTPATYDWSQVDEAGLAMAWSSGMTVIPIVKFTPTWAQKWEGMFCGPPSESALDEFAQFLGAVAARYSQPPFNIHYWEIGNEVDMPYQSSSPDNVFGCWGDWNDPYFGGEYYGKALRQVTPAIKAADPQAKVLIGGLLLECDPDNPPEGKDCAISRFLEGVLREGGGPYFDIVSYHSYAAYFVRRINEEYYWLNKGMFYDKIDYINRILNKYGQGGKPLFLTEVSILCDERYPGCDPLSDDFLSRQADYVYWAYVRGWAAGLRGVIWFTYEESAWKSSGLYNQSSPKPAYYAYKYLSKTLSGASLVGPLTQYSNVTGFEFRQSNRRLWILWTSDQADHTITLPAGVLAMHDKLGNALPLTSQVTLNSPIVVELGP